MLIKLGFLFLRRRLMTAALCGAMLLSSCGGGGSGSGGTIAPAPAPSPTPTPTPTPISVSPVGCSLRERQDWALAQLQEWYLFPTLLDATVNPASYSNVDDYIDALIAPARAQSKDRFFTYLTSIAEENAYYEQGSTAGFGFRLGLDSTARRLFVTEAFEGGPALLAGIDRGVEITSVGKSVNTLQSVNVLLTSGGTPALVDALGPDTPGTTRTLVFTQRNGSSQVVNVTKVDFALDPVSDRYGAKVILDGTKKVGYINLRTFIDTADPDLRAAFADFKAQGVTELIVDLRYNGGGLVSIAELMGDLMGQGKAGQVFSYLTLRPSKASENSTTLFRAQPEAIAPTKIAFIGTGSTASASELVIIGMLPYLGNNMALIGSNTYGKPVGQIALDRSQCDDRLRAIAFKTENANHQGEYFTGLASVVPKTCRVVDDIGHALGDPTENMISGALNFLRGGSCTAISAITTQSVSQVAPLVPPTPQGTIQREVPGVY